MKISYLSQIVNLSGSILLLVFLLLWLNEGAYLQWIIFTAIAGAFINLENSLSTVSSRYISREFHSGRVDKFRDAVGQLRRIYHRFAWLVFLVMMIGGGSYLYFAGDQKFSPNWPVEWLVFCCAYLITFYPASNCCLLIALHYPAVYSTIILLTRLLNIALAIGLIWLGYGVLGLALSVLVSATICAAAFKVFADRALATNLKPAEGAAQPAAVDDAGIRFTQVVYHGAFIFTAYSLYRYGLFLDTGLTDNTASQASFGLALQIFMLIVTVSVVPLTMRVAPLVRAVLSNESERVMHELGLLSAYVNLVFVMMTAGLLILGPYLLSLLPVRGAQLPDTIELASLGAAFLIEVNILIFANVLIAAQNFRFIYFYAAGAAIGCAVGTLLWLNGSPFYFAFVQCPLVIQLCVTLPALAWLTRRTTNISMAGLAAETLKCLAGIVRHPIRVGLAFGR